MTVETQAGIQMGILDAINGIIDPHLRGYTQKVWGMMPQDVAGGMARKQIRHLAAQVCETDVDNQIRALLHDNRILREANRPVKGGNRLYTPVEVLAVMGVMRYYIEEQVSKLDGRRIFFASLLETTKAQFGPRSIFALKLQDPLSQLSAEPETPEFETKPLSPEELQQEQLFLQKILAGIEEEALRKTARSAYESVENTSWPRSGEQTIELIQQLPGKLSDVGCPLKHPLADGFPRTLIRGQDRRVLEATENMTERGKQIKKGYSKWSMVAVALYLAVRDERLDSGGKLRSIKTAIDEVRTRVGPDNPIMRYFHREPEQPVFDEERPPTIADQREILRQITKEQVQSWAQAIANLIGYKIVLGVDYCSRQRLIRQGIDIPPAVLVYVIPKVAEDLVEQGITWVEGNFSEMNYSEFYHVLLVLHKWMKGNTILNLAGFLPDHKTRP